MKGQPFSDLNVATDQDTILNYFFNNGYPDATFEATVTPLAEPQRMSLVYIVNPGERQFVRDVLISGLDATDEGLVRERIRNLNPGDPLVAEQHDRESAPAVRLGIFARVDTALQNPDGDTDRKYVLYRLEEARRYSLTGGFGAQIARIGRGNPTFTTPAGTAGFSPRVSFGISRSNFLGLGHTVGFQGRLSNIQRRALVNYLGATVQGQRSSEPDVYCSIRRFARRSDVQLPQSGDFGPARAKSNAKRTRCSTGFLPPPSDRPEDHPALVPLFAQNISWQHIGHVHPGPPRRSDRSETRYLQHAGWSFRLESIRVEDYLYAAAGTKRHVSPAYSRRDSARSLSLGVINRISAAEVPLPERFFAGGATSHRGFNENQAGPRDLLTGFPLGRQSAADQ